MDGALCLEAWIKHLPTTDPDREFILQGVREGFRITTQVYEGPPTRQKNYKSATCKENFSMVEAQIKTEVENGRYVICEDPPHLISALGAIPKPDGKKVRLIHDCSRPEGGALNDFAMTESFSYQTLRDAAALIKPGDFLAKVDLSNAYRSVRIHPDEHHLTGLQWVFSGEKDPTFIKDVCLPFGSRLSPKIFNCLTQAVRRIMEKEKQGQLVAYLDDFLIIGKTYEECREVMEHLMQLLRTLGFSINYSKVEGPKQKIVFLGVEINTREYTFSLPETKLRDLRNEVAHLMTVKQVTKRGLQSVIGKLNWAALLVYGGRPHIRRLIDRQNVLRGPNHKTRVTTDMREDLLWWMIHMEHFNGTMPIAESRPTSSVCIDACDSGGGGYHDGDWYHVAWRDWPEVQGHHINYKEVMALVPAVSLWGHAWRGKQVWVYSDNQAAVAIFNRGTAKDPRVMEALRNVFWASVHHDFRIQAIYYPGRYNVVADAASRLSNIGGWERLQKTLEFTHL